MCGIIGVWDEHARWANHADAIGRGLSAMESRGPDETGLACGTVTSLGMCRLSIIDVVGGHQPVRNEDERIQAVVNGEIYNYRALADDLMRSGHRLRSRSDSEVLVHLFEDHGTEAPTKLQGMFAFALYDERREQLMLARDRFGQKPLFFWEPLPGAVLFASELKGLAATAAELGLGLRTSDQAIYDYLSLGVVPQPFTIFEGVRAVPAGTWISFGRGGERARERYWRPKFAPKVRISAAAAQDRTKELVSDAVRVRLHSDVPLGVFLSGGVDSSVVAYEASRVLGSDLETFTVAVDDADLDEAGVAARTARHLGVKNTRLNLQVAPVDELRRLVNHYDQPFADPSGIPSMAIARLAREHVKVVLNGDGGDEVFGGYRRHVAARWTHVTGLVPTPHLVSKFASLIASSPATRRTSSGLLRRLFRSLEREPGLRYLITTTDMLFEADKREAWLGSQERPTEDFARAHVDPELSGLDRQQMADISLNLLSALLVKMDMAASAASLEPRSPFLDHRVADFVFKLPARIRVPWATPKALLRSAYRGVLPDEVLDAPKRGFEIPLNRWLSRDLKDVLMDTVGSPTARLRSFLDGSFINRVLERRALSDRNWAYIVYSWLILELWLMDVWQTVEVSRETRPLGEVQSVDCRDDASLDRSSEP